MDTHPASFKGWLHDEAGVTAIEYGLLAALIALAIVGAIGATGRSVDALYTSWSDAVLQALPGGR